MPSDSAHIPEEDVFLNGDEDEDENEDMTVYDTPSQDFANSNNFDIRTSTTQSKRKSSIKPSIHSIQKAKNKSHPISSSVLASSSKNAK